MLNSGRKSHERYMGLLMSREEWVYWEIKRHILHNETPGRFGVFGTDEVAT